MQRTSDRTDLYNLQALQPRILLCVAADVTADVPVDDSAPAVNADATIDSGDSANSADAGDAGQIFHPVFRIARVPVATDGDAAPADAGDAAPDKADPAADDAGAVGDDGGVLDDGGDVAPTGIVYTFGAVERTATGDNADGSVLDDAGDTTGDTGGDAADGSIYETLIAEAPVGADGGGDAAVLDDSAGAADGDVGFHHIILETSADPVTDAGDVQPTDIVTPVPDGGDAAAPTDDAGQVDPTLLEFHPTNVVAPVSHTAKKDDKGTKDAAPVAAGAPAGDQAAASSPQANPLLTKQDDLLTSSDTLLK